MTVGRCCNCRLVKPGGVSSRGDPLLLGLSHGLLRTGNLEASIMYSPFEAEEPVAVTALGFNELVEDEPRLEAV